MAEPQANIQPPSQPTAPVIAPQSLPGRITRKITAGDVDSIAQLVAKRLTESEACAALGIPRQAWYNWKLKAKHGPKWEDSLTRIKGSYLQAQLANIEQGAIGIGPHKKADWRASDRLLAIVSPERYGQQQSQDAGRAPAVPSITVNVWTDLAGTVASPGQVIDVPEVKALADKKPE